MGFLTVICHLRLAFASIIVITLLLCFRPCNLNLSTMAVARSSVNENYDMEEIWEDLKSGIEQIFARQTLPKGRFMKLYTHVYNYCTSVHQNNTAASATAAGARQPTAKTKKGAQPGGAQFVGLELYKRLKEYLKSYQVGLLEVRMQ